MLLAAAPLRKHYILICTNALYLFTRMSVGGLLFSKSLFDVFYKAEGMMRITELKIYEHLDNLMFYRTDEF